MSSPHTVTYQTESFPIPRINISPSPPHTISLNTISICYSLMSYGADILCEAYIGNSSNSKDMKYIRACKKILKEIVCGDRKKPDGMATLMSSTYTYHYIHGYQYYVNNGRHISTNTLLTNSHILLESMIFIAVVPAVIISLQLRAYIFEYLCSIRRHFLTLFGNCLPAMDYIQKHQNLSLITVRSYALQESMKQKRLRHKRKRQRLIGVGGNDGSGEGSSPSNDEQKYSLQPNLDLIMYDSLFSFRSLFFTRMRSLKKGLTLDQKREQCQILISLKKDLQIGFAVELNKYQSRMKKMKSKSNLSSSGRNDSVPESDVGNDRNDSGYQRSDKVNYISDEGIEHVGISWLSMFHNFMSSKAECDENNSDGNADEHMPLLTSMHKLINVGDVDGNQCRNEYGNGSRVRDENSYQDQSGIWHSMCSTKGKAIILILFLFLMYFLGSMVCGWNGKNCF